MTYTSNLLQKELDNLMPTVLNLRKQLHAYPELGYREYKTTDTLVDYLRQNHVPVMRFTDITGAVALIDNGCGKTVAIRVDIDALPIAENTGVDYRSRNSGVMHACGHDVHASVGAGLAVILNRMKDRLPVNAKIIFQPAEECNPDGGAKGLIARRVLNNPDVSAILGFHVWPDYKVGQIGLRVGPVMASSDRFKIIIRGEKSHAAQPHRGVDAISIGVNAISLIQGLNKEIDPFESAVISIGQINSQGRYNIICDYIEIEGTIRTFNDAVREKIHRRMDEILKGVSIAQGGNYKLNIEQGYDAVVNDTGLTLAFAEHAATVLGSNSVNTDAKPSLIGEDFGAFGKLVPSLYFHLGCDSPYPLHHDQFLADERCMETAIKLLASFTLAYTTVPPAGP